MKITRKLIKTKKNPFKVFTYIPVDILKNIKYDEKQDYEVEFWLTNNVICINLVKKKGLKV